MHSLQPQLRPIQLHSIVCLLFRSCSCSRSFRFHIENGFAPFPRIGKQKLITIRRGEWVYVCVWNGCMARNRGYCSSFYLCTKDCGRHETAKKNAAKPSKCTGATTYDDHKCTTLDKVISWWFECISASALSWESWKRTLRAPQCLRASERFSITRESFSNNRRWMILPIWLSIL